jgi:hypothetical protein
MEINKVLIIVVDAIPRNPVGKTDKKSSLASHSASASTTRSEDTR